MAARHTLKTTNLKWETSKTTDVGLELGLFNNEVTFHVNYFYKKNVDLLATIDLNLSSGQIFEINSSNETPYVNTASVENPGLGIYGKLAPFIQPRLQNECNRESVDTQEQGFGLGR